MPDLYFESAGMILTLVTVGKYLEERSRGKTTGAISALLALAPESAMVRRQGQELTIPTEEIVAGDALPCIVLKKCSHMYRKQQSYFTQGGTSLSVPSSRNSFLKKKSHGSLFSPMTNSMTCLSFYDCYSILFLHSLRCRKS